VRGHVFAVAAALALAVTVPAAGARHAVHYRIVAATASATLAFHTENPDESESSDGTVTLAASNSRKGTASVPGRAVVALKGTIKERVKTTRTPSGSSPYQETCSDAHKVGGSGGIALRRVGKMVEARWAFPQANVTFCHGPKVGKSITSKMKRLYAASTFQRTRVTLVVSGSRKAVSGTTTMTYRWTAKVTLASS
jgi:hypothetical protein